MPDQRDPVDSPITVVESTHRLLEQENTPIETYREQLSQLHGYMMNRYKPSSDSSKRVGGFEQSSFEFPEDVRVFVFGDIHARPKVLSKALREIEKTSVARGSTLDDDLRTGSVVFAFLGDYVHSERNVNNYQNSPVNRDRAQVATENLNTVLGLSQLAIGYPKSVFLVKGNHDDAATREGKVSKLGVDQGLSLHNVLYNKGLEEKFQGILDVLPLITTLRFQGNKHILLSHALPIGDLKEFMGRPYSYQNTPANTSMYTGALPIADSYENLRKRLKHPNDNTKSLFLWSKVRNAMGDASEINPDVVPHEGEDEELTKQMKQSVLTYLGTFLMRTFGYTRDGKKVNPEDFFWFLGHEDRNGVSNNIANWLGINDKNVHIFQINDAHNLPVVGLTMKKLAKTPDINQYVHNQIRKYS